MVEGRTEARQTDGQTDRRTEGGRADGRTVGRVDGRVDGGTDRRTDGRKPKLRRMAFELVLCDCCNLLHGIAVSTAARKMQTQLNSNKLK